MDKKKGCKYIYVNPVDNIVYKKWTLLAAITVFFLPRELLEFKKYRNTSITKNNNQSINERYTTLSKIYIHK